MSNYSQAVFFAPKDSLLTGNPAKLIKGAEVDPELSAIATAIASKYDSSNFTFANPSATIGLAAVNGTAATPMRSDAAPALSQAIAPTWTALHTFTPASGVGVKINAVANSAIAILTAPNTSGQSLGLDVRAGTNTTDFGLIVRNATLSTVFQVRGDGMVQAVDQGGTQQDVGWRDTPQNSQTVNYILALSDRGKAVVMNGAATTITIPANASVAFPAGSTIVIVNNLAGNLSIGITTDQMFLAGTLTSGTRTLAAGGIATVMKTFNGTTQWIISGAGLS